MKTKNIFRMLLVAAALLLGANNVKASESLPYNNSNGENRVEIVFEAFKNASSSDILRITYKVTEFGNEYYTPSYAITIGNNSGGSPIVKDLKPNVANNQTSIDVALSEFSSVINTTDGNNCSIYVQGSALAITGIVLVTSGNTPITTYTVTVNTGSNGSASANPTSTTAGQTVTITTNPNNGFEVDAVTVENVTVTKTSDNTYTFQMPGNNVTVNVTFKAIQQVTYETGEYAQVNIGSTGYATFSSTSAINFASVSGLKAYIATAIDLDQNKVTLTQVRGTVAAGTGLILIKDNNIETSVFNLPESSATGTSYSDSENLLMASNAYTNLSHSDPSYTYYVLVQRGNVAKFAEVYDNDAVPGEGKAYLRINKVSHAQARTRSLSIEFSNGTTGISTIENEESDNVIYNLRGQRVENPTKGLYIINGKKVILK